MKSRLEKLAVAIVAGAFAATCHGGSSSGVLNPGVPCTLDVTGDYAVTFSDPQNGCQNGWFGSTTITFRVTKQGNELIAYSDGADCNHNIYAGEDWGNVLSSCTATEDAPDELDLSPCTYLLHVTGTRTFTANGFTGSESAAWSFVSGDCSGSHSPIPHTLPCEDHATVTATRCQNCWNCM